MSRIQMRIEPYAGSDITEVCREAVRISKTLYVDIWFNFNNVKVLARPKDNPEKIVKAFHKTIKSKTEYKIAVAK